MKTKKNCKKALEEEMEEEEDKLNASSFLSLSLSSLSLARSSSQHPSPSGSSRRLLTGTDTIQMLLFIRASFIEESLANNIS